jgi:hypothetical protein
LTEVQEEESEKEEVIEYSPDPDVKLVRNIWTRGNVEERVNPLAPARCYNSIWVLAGSVEVR